ncbi:MAG: SGNH/GDSL hydrolase family protein, partial [Acidobacteria bacterium]|nr:SGNH/GDSL hydrolase family protein [Acidobacteriota bacterium]
AALSDELGIDNLIYREPDDAVWNDAWKVTEKLLVLMRGEVKSHGAKFLVVTLSNAAQVHPNPSLRREFLKRVGANDLFYPDLRIKALGDREGFDVLNLAPALQSYAEQNKVFIHGFGANTGNGHWNELGHALAGELITQKLCEGAAN